MKILGRSILLKEIPSKIIDFLKMMYWAFVKFRNPMVLINSYLSQTIPKEGKFILRNGTNLFLSKNNHDSITVMVIFCRKEYGLIKSGSIVVDIGANIGMFSLYAANSGAKKVFAYEPNIEAFKILCKNIKENKMQDIIIPFNLGVSDIDNKIVYIPKESSPYNKASHSPNSNQYVEVKTISLNTIANNVVEDKINFCKIDCEGAEYEILYAAAKDTFANIELIRMENHKESEKKNLIKHLDQHGFKLVYEHNLILWFKK